MEDRFSAIRAAIGTARPNDIVVLLGQVGGARVANRRRVCVCVCVCVCAGVCVCVCARARARA
jgi:hypothetical protein